MKKSYIYFLSLLCVLFLGACSNAATPEDTVTAFLTETKQAYEENRDLNVEKIYALHCNKREPVNVNDRDADGVMSGMQYIYGSDFEIIATGYSENGEAALVRVKMTTAKRKSEFDEDIFLSKVDDKWLIDIYTDNDEYYEAKEKLDEILIVKAEEELAAKPEEDFDTFISKFVKDYGFQVIRTKFPVGYSVYIWEDGTEEKTELTLGRWNDLRFQEFIIIGNTPVKDEKGGLTYTWETDGGYAGGTATFTLIEKEWYLTNYTSFSM